MSENTTKTQDLGKQDRSTSNPYIDLSEAVTELREIRNKLGRGPYSRDSIAVALGHKTLTGPASRKIAALVQFGLLTRQGNSYKQSDLADRILLNNSEEERNQAILEAMRNPKLYSSLLERFADQSLPSLLTNILARDFGISEKTAISVANTFRTSAEYAGMLKNGIILKNQEVNEENEEISNESNPFSNNPNVPTNESIPKNRTVNLNQIEQDMQKIILPSGVIILFPARMSYNITLGDFAEPIKTLDSIAQKIKPPQESEDEN